MKKSIIGILVCMLVIFSGFSIATSITENTPPYVPSNPHPTDGAIDIGVKTHLSWVGGDPDAGEKAVYDLYFGTETNPNLLVLNLDKPNYFVGVLNHTTQYFWKVIAKDEQGGTTEGPEWTFTTNNCTCDPPEQPQGPTQVRNRTRYEYTTQIMNQNQNGWYYNFSWGDGNHTGWIGPYNNTERVRAEHEWGEPGEYQVQARARFKNGRSKEEWTTTGWSESLYVTVSVKAKANYELGSSGSTLNEIPPARTLNDGSQLMQRIRYMICDMLGICLGGCELVELTGELTYDGTNFFIGIVELHFGPNWYITSAIAVEDYDGDGEIELVFDEIMGLVGTEITVEGHMQSEEWMSVFTINDLVYREPGQPIWAWQHVWNWRNRNNQQ